MNWIITNNKEVKKNMSRRRRHTKAGLAFPITMIRKEMKLRMPDRKLSKGVDVFLSAALEEFVKQWLEASAVHVKKSSHIDAKQLAIPLNEQDGALAGLFPKNVTGLYLE